jgi:hypothetical protein
MHNDVSSKRQCLQPKAVEKGMIASVDEERYSASMRLEG